MTIDEIIKYLDKLHIKILRSPFVKNVTENEIDALLEAKKTLAGKEHCIATVKISKEDLQELVDEKLIEIKVIEEFTEEYNNKSINGDLISRSLLLEALDKSDKDARSDADIQGYCDGWNDAVEIINEQPTVYNNGWIPCSERLPETEDDVLVWYEYYRYGNYNRLVQTIGISFIFDGKWSGLVNGSSGWSQLRIIAWQPLVER